MSDLKDVPPPAYPSASSSTTNTYPPDTKQTSTYLTIHAIGKSWNDFHTRSKQLEISITDASETQKYLNVRPNKSSSSCVLYRTHNSTQQQKLSETTYKWGPGRHPVMKFYSSTSPTENLAEELTIGSKFFSRTTVFPSSRYGKFTWTYASRNMNGSICGKGVGDICLIQLADVSGNDTGEKEVARLVRSAENRPEGTRWHEGTGGLLQLGPLVVESGVDMEVFVVSTVLLMLKKELDEQLNGQVVLIT